jgi:hypothetical protein
VGASTKSSKGRRVRLLSRPAVAALKDHRERQLEERMRLAGSGPRPPRRDRLPPQPLEPAQPLLQAHKGALRCPGRPTLPRPQAHLRHAALAGRRLRQGGLRDAGSRLDNHHPQHLLPRPARHAGPRGRRDGAGAEDRVVSGPPRVAVRLQ